MHSSGCPSILWTTGSLLRRSRPILFGEPFYRVAVHTMDGVAAHCAQKQERGPKAPSMWCRPYYGRDLLALASSAFFTESITASASPLSAILMVSDLGATSMVA